MGICSEWYFWRHKCPKKRKITFLRWKWRNGPSGPPRRNLWGECFAPCKERHNAKTWEMCSNALSTKTTTNWSHGRYAGISVDKMDFAAVCHSFCRFLNQDKLFCSLVSNCSDRCIPQRHISPVTMLTPTSLMKMQLLCVCEERTYLGQFRSSTQIWAFWKI